MTRRPGSAESLLYYDRPVRRCRSLRANQHVVKRIRVGVRSSNVSEKVRNNVLQRLTCSKSIANVLIFFFKFFDQFFIFYKLLQKKKRIFLVKWLRGEKQNFYINFYVFSNIKSKCAHVPNVYTKYTVWYILRSNYFWSLAVYVVAHIHKQNLAKWFFFTVVSIIRTHFHMNRRNVQNAEK